MKTFLIIVFFTATALLICLTYLFLHLIDSGGKTAYLVLDVAGMVASIVLLIFLLMFYINQPPDNGSG
ncbi:MAG TPA: hypothetical protein VIL90_01205 [Puia sp.]